MGGRGYGSGQPQMAPIPHNQAQFMNTHYGRGPPQQFTNQVLSLTVD